MRKLSALVIVVMFMSFGLIAYGVDNRAKSGNEDEVLVVKNWKDEYIGSAHHVLLDSSTGIITFIVLSLGKGEKEVLIPLSAFSSYNHNTRTLVLGVNKEILVAAPEFHVSDLRDSTFAERVYRFYGGAPPWTDGAREGEKSM
jgi:hypothetical protein